ncbi:unnamed protein product [Symbiodinium sp. CCMP2592]|nr:unnamed protein product [Symbiodinium sp. CCMP2592]
MSLAEAHACWVPLNKEVVVARPVPCGATPLTEPASVTHAEKSEERVDMPATALFCATATDAILDTGASRCVMGKSLLPGFLQQLSETVRAQVKVMQSAVRFRFGNNQTLLSDRRILLPFKTASRKTLWLSIEVVPGKTPLLFSKKAIKQLGGLIDTEKDVVHLRRLPKSLPMRVGPTGLYLR